MARAHGARAQMALAFETVYGTPPASGYRLMPFARTTLGAEQPLLNSELLGYGRDPLAPIKDAVTADGEVVVPIDVENFGLWLKAAFGAPTTTGTTPKTHTFQSGNWTLPSMAIEVAMPEVPRFAMYAGCVIDQLSWQMSRSGLLTATARLIAQGEAIAATTAAGTPTALGLQRFGHFNGVVKRNGTSLGNVVSAEITYANGLDRIETIRNDGKIEGADPGMAALTGRIEVRFADSALVTGATTAGVTKTVNIGTGGASGSTTVVNIGSASAGASGTTVINTPTVTFANAVTHVGMPQANLTAQLLGLGGATADSYNRLSINTPAALLNNAGAGIEATVNKATAGNDAAFAFKTGFSARALIGLLGNDDFSFKVSPDGSAFFDAFKVDRTNGRVELAEPVVLPAHDAVPSPPPAGKLALYARDRAGMGWLDVERPSGRHFPLQPHFGVNRIATWAPSTSTTINTNGMPRTAVGTAATPTLATTNLSTSMRRWRMTSAATVGAAAEERSAGWVCWRGNAEGLGGFTYVNRLSLVTLQATGMGFFGLIGSVAALSTTLTLSAVVNALGIGFERGTHANWQIVHNDGAGAPTLIDLGPGFPVASTTNVLTLYIAAAPNDSEVGIRVVEEVSGAVAEATITTDMPAATQLLSPRNYLNNGTTAAAIAYDCSGVYVETDY